jgi:hypothetical protein
MLIGTCAPQGCYLTVAVERDEAERAWVVIEGQDRPGLCSHRGRIEHSSLEEARRGAEMWVLARGGVLGAEAETLAGSPVAPQLAAAMFSQRGIGRFMHLPAAQAPDD